MPRGRPRLRRLVRRIVFSTTEYRQRIGSSRGKGAVYNFFPRLDPHDAFSLRSGDNFWGDAVSVIPRRLGHSTDECKAAQDHSGIGLRVLSEAKALFWSQESVAPGLFFAISSHCGRLQSIFSLVRVHTVHASGCAVYCCP